MLSLSYVLLAISAWISYEWYAFTSTRSKLSAIPTVGSDSFILAYLSAWKFLFSGRDLIQEGYEKYPGGIFKVATLETGSRWLVVVNSQKFIQEIKDAKDEVLSNHEFSIDLLQGTHTFGERETATQKFHVGVVKTNLTKSLATRFSDITDEITQAFEDHLPASDGEQSLMFCSFTLTTWSRIEWTQYSIVTTLLPIVCRTSNRLFVGKPLCREPEYLEIQQDFALHVMIAASLVNLTPTPLKKIVGYLVSTVPKTIARLRKFYEAPIEERIQLQADHGNDWEVDSDDFIGQLLKAAPADCRNVRDITVTLILVNFAAIHTTSITASYALIELASRPQYIEPLRKEIADIVNAHGWTKDSLSKMHKLDSFIKEIARWKGLACTSVTRKAMKDFTFSNGVVVPAGVSLAAASASVHLDSDIYEDGSEFKGFRFSDKYNVGEGSESVEPAVKDQLVGPSTDFLFFSLGKHACPGRWFAANEIKCIIAHVLMNYDLKAPEEPYPPPKWIGSQQIPDSKAQIYFKKRHTL
ncbi:cytochrome P450 [Coprinopsis sp. MPI-PUGE-AT-0042]|nr:cytochrome P450 [Coprinopsis sp. MPI-PUGE-AT-0042]